MKRFTEISILKSRLAWLGVMMLALPLQALAQPFYSCSSTLTMDTPNGGPYYIDEAITIEMTLAAGTVSDGTTPGYLEIQEFDFKPDCDGGDFFSCAAAGNTVLIDPENTGFGGTCATDFTVTPVGDGVTWTFEPTTTLRLASQTSCTVTFDIVVDGVAPGNDTIFETGGWAETQTLCTGPDPFTPYPGVEGASASSALSFTLSTQRTAFRVSKDFTDDGDGEADMYIQCNSGLPLTNDYTLLDDGWVEFVVKDFVTGAMDCHVYEDPIPEGYEASYVADNSGGDGIAGDWYADETGCYFEDVTSGLFTCDVTNSMLPLSVEVTKVWEISSESNIEIEYLAEADYTCYNVYTSADGGELTDVEGTLYFEGATDTETIDGLYAAADGSSYCTVTEPFIDDHVEVDASDCEDVPVETGASCTIYNSVFFEGVPTLSQYGLALLTLLMLGMGVIAVRRFA